MKRNFEKPGSSFPSIVMFIASYIITGPIPTFLERLITLLKEPIHLGCGEAVLNVVPLKTV